MNGNAVECFYDNHSASSGDGFEGSLSFTMEEGEAVVVRVFGSVGNIADVDFDVGFDNFFAVVEES